MRISSVGRARIDVDASPEGARADSIASRRTEAWSLAFGLGCVASTFGLVATPGVRTAAKAQADEVVEVVHASAPVHAAADGDSPSVGALAAGTRLRALGHVGGRGCPSGFVAVEGGGFVCARHLERSSLAPFAEPQPRVPEGALLPRRFVLTRAHDTPGYARPEDQAAGVAAERFGRRYGLVSYGRTTVGGVTFYRLARGTFVRAEDVDRARPSDFAGIALAPGEALSHAFVRRDDTPVRDPSSGAIVRRLDRRAVVRVVRVDESDAVLDDGNRIAVADLRRAEPTDPPAGIAPNERWIDVSVREQVLVVYEGASPVFVTLVSTGANRPDRRTPIGEFRIWAKHVEADMDETGNDDPTLDYRVERVPWVQFFEGGVALHASYWHDDFGNPRSHGCVNLSPRDARTIFGLTEPSVPPGWLSRISTADRPGTRVRVRP